MSHTNKYGVVSYDPYFEKRYSSFDPRPYYTLNGENKCPRCGTGAIIRDLQDKVCLACGARDSFSIQGEMADYELKVLMYNRPGY